MKCSYYKNSEHVLFNSIAIVIVGIMLSSVAIYTRKYLFLWITIGIVALYSVILYLARKIIFRKVEISTEYLHELYNRKTYAKLLWVDVLNVEKRHLYRTQSLVFTSANGQAISLNVTKKKLKQIIEICPSNSLKEELRRVKLIFDDYYWRRISIPKT